MILTYHKRYMKKINKIMIASLISLILITTVNVTYATSIETTTDNFIDQMVKSFNTSLNNPLLSQVIYWIIIFLPLLISIFNNKASRYIVIFGNILFALALGFNIIVASELITIIWGVLMVMALLSKLITIKRSSGFPL